MGGGPMNDLAQRLSAAAEEAADTDYEALRARVFATSRRLGRRRRVVAAGAVLALGGAVAGAVGLVPHRHSGPAPASAPPALVYLRETGGRLAVVTVSGDHTTTTDFGPVGQADQLRLVSPDGNRVALVVTPDTHNYASGDLVIVSPG